MELTPKMNKSPCISLIASMIRVAWRLLGLKAHRDTTSVPATVTARSAITNMKQQSLFHANLLLSTDTLYAMYLQLHNTRCSASTSILTPADVDSRASKTGMSGKIQHLNQFL